MDIKLGIITPILSLRPGGHAEWERTATINEVMLIAAAADQLGYAHMSCSEHIAVGADAEGLSGNSYWDPLVTFGYLAGYTHDIRFLTSVLVLPFHHPLEIAKRYGNLDQVSGGRLVLGVGAGYAEQEFNALGVPFDDRGPRTDDAMRALRASLGTATPAYDGPYYKFSDVIVEPHALQERVPLWVGGQSRRSLRRAVELGDGWMPFAVSTHQVREWLDDAAKTDAWQQRDTPLEVTLVTEPPLDPMGDLEGAERVVRELHAAGATTIALRFVHESLSHYLQQAAMMINLVEAM